MPVFIALYRGLNVGGGTSVKMEALRALHERLGQQDVRHYIQSGNVTFAAQGTARGISAVLMKSFAAEFGFAARVIVIEASQWMKLAADNPYAVFAAADPKRVHLALCDGTPSQAKLEALLAKTGGREDFTIRKGAIYLHAPDGFGTSKFAAGMEKAAGVPVTARNWRTVEALSALLKNR